MCLGGPASCRGFDIEDVWAEVLQDLGMEKQGFRTFYGALSSLIKPVAEEVVLFFDDVTYLTRHPGALFTFVQQIRSLQASSRWESLIA